MKALRHKVCGGLAYLIKADPKAGDAVLQEECLHLDGSAVSPDESLIMCDSCKSPLSLEDITMDGIEDYNAA